MTTREYHRRRSLMYLSLLGIPMLWALSFEFKDFSMPYPSGSEMRDRRPVDQIEATVSQNKSKNKTRVLMVQYSGDSSANVTSSYTSLLDLTQPINQAYADMWGYDYVLKSGYMIVGAFANDTTFRLPLRESLATYNKVMILEMALTDPTYQQYDALLLLDADALVYDFDVNVVSILLPTDKVFVAHQVRGTGGEESTTDNVNIGVTLWNLRHDNILSFVKVWKKECLFRVRHQPHLRDSDQTPLQHILRHMTPVQRDRFVLALSNNQLGYSQGKLIRHFIRPDAKNWTASNDTTRMRIAQIQATIDTICGRHPFTATRHPNVCSYYYNTGTNFAGTPGW